MSAMLGYYDWLLPENRNVGVIPPSASLSDSSTGGVVVGSVATLTSELMTALYGRTGISRSLGEKFIIDVKSNDPVLGETIAFYGAIAALGVKVRVAGTDTYVDAKVTITVDPNSGSYGGGATFSQVVLLGAANAEGQGTYPNRNAVVFPWSETATDQIKRNGGRGGSQVNKIRITIEPRAGTGGATGVDDHDVFLNRIFLPRCFYGCVANGTLEDDVDDISEKQRAYGGYPYINRKPPMRQVRAQLTGIPKAFVYGAEKTTEVAASVRAVNGFAGESMHVLFSPRHQPDADEISAGMFLPAWSNEHIFGLLDDSLRASLQSTTTTSKKMLWTAQVAITETPLP